MPLSFIPEPVGNAKAEARSVDLGVSWESGWKEFGTSLGDFFAGPRPLKDSELREPAFRMEWIRGKVPGRAFLASCLWHAAAILIAILPIWGFLPAVQQNLAPIQIESTLYFLPADLPNISLPKPASHPSPKPNTPDDASKSIEPPGANAFHPRQTILSIPVQVTHPRQTLIQPDAPAAPPKVDPQLPNIVQWTAPALARPHLQLAPTSAAPRMRQRTVKDVAVPEVANNEKNAGPLNIAASANVTPQPQMPLSPMTAATAQQRQARQDAAAAPDIGVEGDANLHRIIALSATPGPPVPQLKVPQGNLAARVSISPEGPKPGVPGGSANGASDAAGSADRNASKPSSSAGGGTGNPNSLPAAVIVSGGIQPRVAGGIAPAGSRSEKLNLTPKAQPDFTPSARRGPAEIAALDSSLPPEKILSGKEVYSMDVNMPNFTSVAGSWVLYFAQLDEGDGPRLKPQGRLSSPVPVEKADPKYPPDLVKDHVDGEVVLYAIIRKDGSVDSIQVVRSIDPQLDKNAIAALARWKFRPGARDGVPVDLEAVIHIPFRFRSPQN